MAGLLRMAGERRLPGCPSGLHDEVALVCREVRRQQGQPESIDASRFDNRVTDIGQPGKWGHTVASPFKLADSVQQDHDMVINSHYHLLVHSHAQLFCKKEMLQRFGIAVKLKLT